jgi:hypothetical protein
MTFHFKPPTTCQPTASPEQALGEEKRKLPFLDMLNRDLKREASPLFPWPSDRGPHHGASFGGE